MDLTPTFAAKLSDVVAERIELNSPNFAARVARRAATMITRVVRLADKTALKLGKKAVRQAKASVHRVVAAAVEGDPENAMGSVPPNTQQQQQHAGGSAGAGPGDVEREVTLDIEVGDGPIVGLDLAETLEMTNGSDNDYDDIGDIDSSWGMEDGGATLDDSGAGVDFHKLVEYVFMAAAVIGLGFVGANLKAALSADEDDVLDAESEARWSKMSAKHAAMEVAKGFSAPTMDAKVSGRRQHKTWCKIGKKKEAKKLDGVDQTGCWCFFGQHCCSTAHGDDGGELDGLRNESIEMMDNPMRAAAAAAAGADTLANNTTRVSLWSSQLHFFLVCMVA